MKAARLTAEPVAEGFLKEDSIDVTLWRDYRWNNGQVSRMWFVDPNNLNGAKIEIRPIGAAIGKPNGG